MEIFVFPGSGLTTAPRLAREKSMSRYRSAAAFFIERLLAFVRLPGGDQTYDVAPLVCVHDDEQVPPAAETQSNKARLLGRIRILTGQCKVVLQDRYGLCETHTVSPQVRLRLRRIPFEPHKSVYRRLSPSASRSRTSPWCREVPATTWSLILPVLRWYWRWPKPRSRSIATTSAACMPERRFRTTGSSTSRIMCWKSIDSPPSIWPLRMASGTVRDATSRRVREPAGTP